MEVGAVPISVSSCVSVAQAGDCVISLHILGSNETVDRDGKSSLFSLVKAFDSVLAVYEGFCNLKQHPEATQQS
ncbi:hypothetical protein F0562_017256 [Nyssa sinensis]|uniref:Uncharacterized protein n=1 Tax=Nyssa sinensis TaxID=561372 RepID=A0A5J4ZGY4_9ASTE|nr:hypothetical protein F0562_017256 [Nyssa sinensis]